MPTNETNWRAKTWMHTGVTTALGMLLFAAGCGGDQTTTPVSSKQDPLFLMHKTSSATSSAAEWRIVPSTTDGALYSSSNTVKLKSTVYPRYMIYRARKHGINLKWSSSDSPGSFQFKAQGTSGIHKVEYNEPVAIHVYRGGWLKYHSRKYGINLVWSSTPVYQWRIGGGTSGVAVNAKDGKVSLYNTVAGDYVVYCSRAHGINLRWRKDCKGSTGSVPPPQNVKYVCGLGGCPSNYYKAAFKYSSSCLGSSNKNQTKCIELGDAAVIYVCGTGCPSGYVANGYSFSINCVLGASGNNTTKCNKSNKSSPFKAMYRFR